MVGSRQLVLGPISLRTMPLINLIRVVRCLSLMQVLLNRVQLHVWPKVRSELVLGWLSSYFINSTRTTWRAFRRLFLRISCLTDLLLLLFCLLDLFLLILFPLLQNFLNRELWKSLVLPWLNLSNNLISLLLLFLFLLLEHDLLLTLSDSLQSFNHFLYMDHSREFSSINCKEKI